MTIVQHVMNYVHFDRQLRHVFYIKLSSVYILQPQVAKSNPGVEGTWQGRNQCRIPAARCQLSSHDRRHKEVPLSQYRDCHSGSVTSRCHAAAASSILRGAI